MNNNVLKVSNINFNMSQFTNMLKLFLHCCTFCMQSLLCGYHTPECAGVHELRSCA